ncbi:hypothetical protein EBESD8_60190 [Rhodococcus aetherivorans]|nr:hypothetical protein EBESD8_60190 [Rhodococcus aetherivorans]
MNRARSESHIADGRPNCTDRDLMPYPNGPFYFTSPRRPNTLGSGRYPPCTVALPRRRRRAKPAGLRFLPSAPLLFSPLRHPCCFSPSALLPRPHEVGVALR